jgi:hypothetical protein
MGRTRRDLARDIGDTADDGKLAAEPLEVFVKSSAASNSRRPMVTVIRPSRARCVKERYHVTSVQSCRSRWAGCWSPLRVRPHHSEHGCVRGFPSFFEPAWLPSASHLFSLPIGRRPFEDRQAFETPSWVRVRSSDGPSFCAASCVRLRCGQQRLLCGVGTEGRGIRDGGSAATAETSHRLHELRG